MPTREAYLRRLRRFLGPIAEPGDHVLVHFGRRRIWRVDEVIVNPRHGTFYRCHIRNAQGSLLTELIGAECCEVLAQ